jgi:mRNA interferase MazF
VSISAGDVVRVDFGHPVGSEAGFVRPAIVVTATAALGDNPRTMQVVPTTTNIDRGYVTDVAVDGLSRDSVAQCHLVTTIAAGAIVEGDLGNIGPAALAAIRSVLADLLDV